MANKNIRIGKCTNFQNCTTADSNKSVEVSILEDFECPECGKDLSEVKAPPAPPFKLIGIAVVVGVVVLAAVSYFAKFPASLYSGETVEPITIVTPPVEEPEVIPVEVEPEPEVVPVEVEVEPEVVPVAEPVVADPTHGTISFAYGSYTGKLKNGKASGYGTMTYTQRTLISQYDRKKRYAGAGQYIVGTWYDNKLDNGTLYNSDGTPVEMIQIGRAE